MQPFRAFADREGEAAAKTERPMTSVVDLERLATLLAEHMKPAQEVMTTQEAAEYLRCSTQHLEISRHKGGGPKYVKFSRLVRYRKVDLDAYLAERVRRNTVVRGE